MGRDKQFRFLMARICRADAGPRLTFCIAYKPKILAPTDYYEARGATTADGCSLQEDLGRDSPVAKTIGIWRRPFIEFWDHLKNNRMLDFGTRFFNSRIKYT